MTPRELQTYLGTVLDQRVMLSLMMWGPPGVGKSSIAAQVARDAGLELIDVRLPQLAPTDLRGLPVPDHEVGTARWYPPEFLPRTGRGVLLLDEINMATPAMQGIAQQLVLDRRVGSYVVPEGWFVWAAGNRKEDRAAVFDMPSALGNRFVHLEVAPDLDAFRAYALTRGLHEQILAFLSYRPNLLHLIDPQRPNWPSPRSWEMASHLHHAGLNVAGAVGEPAADEFYAFTRLYENLPDMTRILQGEGNDLGFPAEASARYAVTIGLSLRASGPQEGLNAFRWLSSQAGAEYTQLFISSLLARMREGGTFGEFAVMLQQEPDLQRYLTEVMHLLTS